MDRQGELARVHSVLRALESKKREEARHLKVGCYTVVVIAVAALVLVNRAWGLGVWIIIRELLLHFR